MRLLAPAPAVGDGSQDFETFGTQSTRGNRFIERLSTVVTTCRQHGRAVLAYLREAIAAFLFGRPVPPLVPVPEP